MKLAETSTDKRWEEEGLSPGLLKKIDNLNYSDELAMWAVKDTPFQIARTAEGFHVVMGNYRMSERLGGMKEAIADAGKITWNKITSVIAVFIQYETDGKLKVTKN